MSHPHDNPHERRPIGWEDIFVGAMLLGGAGTAVLFFLSPLIGALFLIQFPYNLVIVGIYASLFCFLGFKAIQDAYSDDEEEELSFTIKIE